MPSDPVRLADAKAGFGPAREQYCKLVCSRNLNDLTCHGCGTSSSGPCLRTRQMSLISPGFTYEEKTCLTRSECLSPLNS